MGSAPAAYVVMSTAGTPVISDSRVVEQAAHLACLEEVGGLAPLQQRRHGDDDATRREDAVVARDELDDVGRQQRDAVAGRDAVRDELRGDRARLAPDLRVRESTLALDQGKSVRGAARRFGEHAGEGERGGDEGQLGHVHSRR